MTWPMIASLHLLASLHPPQDLYPRRAEARASVRATGTCRKFPLRCSSGPFQRPQPSSALALTVSRWTDRLHRQTNPQRPEQCGCTLELRITTQTQRVVQRPGIQLDLLEEPRLDDSGGAAHAREAAECRNELLLIGLLHHHIQIGDREGVAHACVAQLPAHQSLPSLSGTKFGGSACPGARGYLQANHPEMRIARRAARSAPASGPLPAHALLRAPRFLCRRFLCHRLLCRCLPGRGPAGR